VKVVISSDHSNVPKAITKMSIFVTHINSSTNYEIFAKIRPEKCEIFATTCQLLPIFLPSFPKISIYVYAILS